MFCCWIDFFGLALWRQDMKPSLSSAGRVSPTLLALQKVHHVDRWSIIQQRVLHELSGAASRLPLFNRGSWKITQGNQHIPKSQPPLFKMMIFLFVKVGYGRSFPKNGTLCKSFTNKAVVCGCNCQLSSPFSCRLFGTVLKGFQSQLNTLPTIMKGPLVTQQGQMPGPTTATVRTGRWVKFAVGPLRWKTGQLPQAVLDHQHGICWRSWRRSSKIADVAQVLWRNAILTI